MITPTSLENVTKTYGDITALSEVTLSLGKGEILGILGPSGAGKTTILRLMDLLEAPEKGSVVFAGRKVNVNSKEAALLRKRIGVVLQKPVVLNRSVANNLAYALLIRGCKEDEMQSKVDSRLLQFGLQDRADMNARNLSGGEMQRLCFARAMISDPEVLLLDEFSANLDPANVALIEEQIRSYVNEGTDSSVVMVTHNIFQAKRMCNRIALMWGGKLIEVAENHKFFTDPEDPRTAGFVSGETVY